AGGNELEFLEEVAAVRDTLDEVDNSQHQLDDNAHDDAEDAVDVHYRQCNQHQRIGRTQCVSPADGGGAEVRFADIRPALETVGIGAAVLHHPFVFLRQYRLFNLECDSGFIHAHDVPTVTIHEGESGYRALDAIEKLSLHRRSG